MGKWSIYGSPPAFFLKLTLYLPAFLAWRLFFVKKIGTPANVGFCLYIGSPSPNFFENMDTFCPCMNRRKF
jgi:hypothetical protein